MRRIYEVFDRKGNVILTFEADSDEEALGRMVDGLTLRRADDGAIVTRTGTWPGDY